MSLSKKITEIATKTVAKTVEICKKAPVITGQQIELNICMMGPRGVGKTTVLTSIFHNSDIKFAESSLFFRPTGDARDVINKGYSDLSGIFNEYSSDDDTPLPGVSATNKAIPFNFEFGLSGKGKSADINIIDFPGEFVDENHPEHQKVIDYINKSQLIMVAIDTVHLMEENGRFNETRNRSSYICEKILTLISKLPKEEERKLILLVPLKCEKYVVEKRINDVSSSVVTAYKKLIDKVEENYKDRIGIVITPIQTLGSVVFDRFGRDEDNQIKIDPVDNNPSVVKYKFYRYNPNQKPSYRPLYCIQPLYYLVAFTLSQYKRQKKDGVFTGILKGFFGLFSSDLAFYEACQNFVGYIKRDGEGYRVINNPKMF